MVEKCYFCSTVLNDNNSTYQDDICDECFEQMADAEIEKGNDE